MSNSIHTARWLSQIVDQGWDIHLFPSYDVGSVRPELTNVTVYHSFIGRLTHAHPSVKQKGIYVWSEFVALFFREITRRIYPHYRVIKLARLIKKLKPDIVHTLEMQGAGYLTMEAKKLLKGNLPPWIVTTWGSDIYYFGQFKDHAKKIRSLLKQCDYYHCECERDIKLAHKFGLKGISLPVLPDSGGFYLDKLAKVQQNIKPSNRKYIIVKGYHGWAGRALVALKALELCVEELRNFHIFIYSSDIVVRIAANKFKSQYKIPITIIPAGTEHDKMLKFFGQSRIAIGLSISDGISTMVLEAMAMGTFPIQSNTSCANEWIKDGQTGILVPPEDIKKISKAIKHALSDDPLVDNAAILNAKVVKSRLDQNKLSKEVVAIYDKIYKESK